MIIDMLAHIGVKKGEDYKVESLFEIMNASGVDKCMICSQLETINNEYIHECCVKYPDKTIGFAVINPWEMCIRDRGKPPNFPATACSSASAESPPPNW